MPFFFEQPPLESGFGGICLQELAGLEPENGMDSQSRPEWLPETSKQLLEERIGPPVPPCAIINTNGLPKDNRQVFASKATYRLIGGMSPPLSMPPFAHLLD